MARKKKVKRLKYNLVIRNQYYDVGTAPIIQQHELPPIVKYNKQVIKHAQLPDYPLSYRPDIPVVDVIKATYDKTKNLINHGYIRDNDLSDNESVVFYNKKYKHLIFGVAGTHQLSDLIHDTYLASGNLKATSRYTNAKEKLAKSKMKYGTNSAAVVGHSLGGGIVNHIIEPMDNGYIYNPAHTVFDKVKPNVDARRTKYDFASVLGSSQMTTIDDRDANPFDVLGQHSSDKLYGIPWFI